MTSFRARWCVSSFLVAAACCLTTAVAALADGVSRDDSGRVPAMMSRLVALVDPTAPPREPVEPQLPSEPHSLDAIPPEVVSVAAGFPGGVSVLSGSSSPRFPVGMDDPGNLTGHARQVGESFLFRITGTTDGSVWGTDEYTSDSDLSTAAVHAGLVDAGETKVIRAAILPGRRHYTGSLRHGIASRDWGNWGSTYRLAPLAGAIPAEGMQEVIDDPGNVTRFHLPVGATLRVRVTGSIDGFIWGNEPYTYDSDLSTAAVHAGVLQVGETGIVKVTIQPVQYGFPGTERNGVTSRDWLPWDGNYRVERDDANEAR